MTPPYFFRFIRTDFIIPPTAWSIFTLAATTQFHPSFDADYPTLTKFAWGGYFDDDIVALRTMNPHVGKNYSEFSIFERTSDTWSRNFSVTGSDVSTTAGNGVWFVTENQSHNGVNGWDHNRYAMDDSTTYDSSTKTMYVLAATASLSSARTLGVRTGFPNDAKGTPLFKTQKTGENWSALTEVGVLPSASAAGNSGDHTVRTINYMSVDSTLASRTTNTAVYFTNPVTLEIVDEVARTKYDPSGINNTIDSWAGIFGTNHSKTKVYVGGLMEGAGMPSSHRHHAIQILSSGSSAGWGLEGTITGSTGESSGDSIGYWYDKIFHFNDDYAVLGMPRALRTVINWGGSGTTTKRTGCVYIYKKTGATWADHELVQTLEASASYDATGIAQDYSGGARWHEEMLFGRGVRINSNNEILVAAPHFHVGSMEHKAGLVMFLTKSDGSDEWGYQSHHTGSVASTNTGVYPTSAAMFTPRYFGTDRAIVTAPSGSRFFMGFETYKNQEI